MSLFTGRVIVNGKESPYGDPLYNRFWQELGKPLLKQTISARATIEQEEDARNLLKDTLQRCRKRIPETRRYLLGDIHDSGYLGTLMQLRKQLEEGQWGNACHTLCKVIRYYCANDIRTMYAIIGILEEYV